MAPSLTLDGRKLDLREGESVLDALERQGVPMLHSCRSGICQSCLLKAVEGPVSSIAQRGLKDSLKAQGYFLSCMCTPTEDLKVALPGEGIDHVASVLQSHEIESGVRRIRLSIPPGFHWFAGQYITVIRSQGTARSYSIASSPHHGYLELHVRRIPGGSVSNWLHDEVRLGHELRIRGAFGDCFYTPSDSEAPLLLAGTGTGLAPLYGILCEAIRHEHKGPIALFHGALKPEGLYYRDKLTWLSEKSDGKLRYIPCVLDGTNVPLGSRIVTGSLDDVVLAESFDLKHTRAYLCGDPALVDKIRKKLFLKGLSNRHIFADPFVPAAGAA